MSQPDGQPQSSLEIAWRANMEFLVMAKQEMEGYRKAITDSSVQLYTGASKAKDELVGRIRLLTDLEMAWDEHMIVLMEVACLIREHKQLNVTQGSTYAKKVKNSQAVGEFYQRNGQNDADQLENWMEKGPVELVVVIKNEGCTLAEVEATAREIGFVAAIVEAAGRMNNTGEPLLKAIDRLENAWR